MRLQRHEAALVPVWNALGDPSRRAILDLLRAAPRTTGDIAAKFPTSRFAVMKHLGVLEQAGLIAVRRRGRERWNHLNAVPLQMLYERWVKPYEALWAGKLIAFKSHAEGAEMAAKALSSEVQQVEMEIEIRAPRERVWKALVEQPAGWWPRSFYTSPRAKAFRIEPKLGGRMYEDWGGGAGVVWFQIFAMDAPASIDFSGAMAVPYGPAHSFVHIDLIEKEGGTVFKLSDSTMGVITSSVDCKTDGWNQLFRDGLKQFVEGSAHS